MDTTFITGSAAFVASIIVFVGSVFLLLALIMGAKLAYMLTATITLSFTLMMGLVWSYGDPLGPVGQLPEWNEVGIDSDPAAIEFGPAAEYPEGDWEVPEEGDAAAADLETSVGDFLAAAIDDEEVSGYADAAEAQIDQESIRLIESGGDLYGAATLAPLEGTVSEDAEPVVAVMEYDPGNPSGPARMITAGTFILFVGHMIGLSRMEKRATRRDEDDETA